MTCIIGFLSDKKMYIGGDRLGSNGHTGKVVNKPKIFKKGEMLLGYTSTFRFGQIIEHHLDIPKDTRVDPYPYMVQDFVPEVRKCLEKHKYSKSDADGESGTMIVCYRNRLYVFQADWSVLEYTDYCAVGSGTYVAEGALDALLSVNIPAKEKVKKALQSACKIVTSVGEPIDILSLKVKDD